MAQIGINTELVFNQPLYNGHWLWH